MSGCAALVTAAGSSVRMGAGEKKEYRTLDGMPVLARSLLAFRETGLFSTLLVTVPPGHIERVRELLGPFLPTEDIRFVEGGTTRKASVFNGLKVLAESAEPDYVLIHDAARPWISPELIRSVLEAAHAHGAAVPVADICDALVETSPDGEVTRHIPKTNLRAVQTPQGFRFRDIWDAHRKARSSRITFYDDAQVLMHAGKTVFTLPGDPANRKITYPCDLGGQ
ncbi:MAG: 2-C-methyl-D-erythritol 4-phosphate cytidylyltransferase [Spirochaetales bacterium]|nr:2-C-methyl-D-erythritol 4-phosphate cytidylyltransferase [Spirochaetales bacterium]